MGTSADRFERRLASLREAVNRALTACLAPPASAGGGKGGGRLWEAMAYSVLAGGKRLRPILLLLSAEACGGDPEEAMPAACAVELAHTYSLIHDDLPAMDDDVERRGRPTCHVAFDEATAVLAGDALQSLAFEVLTRPAGREGANVREGGNTRAARAAREVRAARLAAELARALGPSGMALGQAADLAAEGKPADLAAVRFIHLHKTAALIRACARMGGICAGADRTRITALGLYGEKCGLAFQIVDDILDVTASTEVLGKTAGKDAAAGKATYPGVVGLEEARAEAARLTAEALDALRPLGEEACHLMRLAQALLDRGA